MQFLKRALPLLLSVVMAAGLASVQVFASEPDGADGAEADAVQTAVLTADSADCEHNWLTMPAKIPTRTEPGYEEYQYCELCGINTDIVTIPAWGEAEITSYEEFVTNLMFLEEVAYEYVKLNPTKDPLGLIIKYIRTGVERYNSGSWGIMAGYEDEDFAEFVEDMENMINVEQGAAILAMTGLKNIENFTIPNGNTVDFGHMFGSMDITYHNKGSMNHADVSGWAGDLVDLLEFADIGGVIGSVEEMTADIAENYLLNTPEDSGIPTFNQLDMYGDLDAYFIMENLYAAEYEAGLLTAIIMEYFTEELDDVARADYFLRNRLGGVSTRQQVRDAVYAEYTGNKMIATLEATREFNAEDISDLRKACCYAFADYICRLAGDFVDVTENPYYEVFSSEFSTLAPGITQEIKYATSADNKQMVYYIATADITRDDVNVYANYNNNDPAAGWEMQRVLDQANAAQAKYGDPESEHYIPNYKVIASTNGAGFNMQTGEPGGLLVMGGVEYHGINASGFFGILKDGTPVIGTTEEYNTIYKDQVAEGIAGFGATLVKDGKVCTTDNSGRASRTAVGITGTGKVVLMVLDGRQEPFSCGGSYVEIAQIMLEAGCVEAVNLDGGGSTTYVSRPEGQDELQVISSPSDGVQRSVSTSLMMVSTAPSSTAFDHAKIESDYSYSTIGTPVQLTAVGLSATGNIAELPEGCTWEVSNTRWGTVTEDGVFTGLRNGSVDVYLVLDDEIIGQKTMTIVTPDTVYFTKTTMDAVYGSETILPVAALYENKKVAISEDDVVLTMSTDAGTIDGYVFVADEASGVKMLKITVALASDEYVKGSITLNLFRQGENTFDFEKAIGGDRQLAWHRDVSNTTTDDTVTYTVVDTNEDMVTSYVFAMDMSEIPIPQQLEDLIYMLPGADMENASAWNFLLQLAERISVLSEVTPVLYFDENFDVDYSELKILTEYFTLEDTVFNEEENSLTLKLNWIDQTKAIDPATANPLCLVSGIKLTPKTDAAWKNNKITAVHTGEISYNIYLRASALYSFAQKPENQEIYGLQPFVNPNLPSEAGAYFGDVYKEFEDSYTLINAKKSGWIGEDGGYAYYVDGEKLTGIQKIADYYYDFGENGINPGRTKYTGLVEIDGTFYYSSLGVLSYGWKTIGQNTYYFDKTSYKMAVGKKTVDGLEYTFDENGVLVRGAFRKTAGGVRYYFGGVHLVSRWFTLEEGTLRVDNNGYVCYGIQPMIETSKPAVWYEFDPVTGVLIDNCSGFIEYEGKTYWCDENGDITYGVVDTGEGLIYCATMGLVAKNTSCYVSASLDSTCGLETGWYRSDANGYIIANGFVTANGTDYYFTDYVRAKGFTKIGEDYYMFNAGNGGMYKDANMYVSGSNPYGFSGGMYYFQADGKMYIPDLVNGERKVIEENGKLYFTIDGVKQKSCVCELDGEYYYAKADGSLYANAVVWVSTNDYIAAGYYKFEADGKLMKDGFMTVSASGSTYYFIDGVLAKGFTKIGEDYYLFNTGSGMMYKNANMWVGGNNPYGITAGMYYFQADGKMYVPDLINGERKVITENGKLYFTIDGVKQKNSVCELDGEYYYAKADGSLYVNAVVWVSANDYIAAGYYKFEADGKLMQNGFMTVSASGSTYYFIDGVLAKGLTKIGEDYYLFNTGSGMMYKNANMWVGGNNPYGITAGMYYFQADGKMYVPDLINGERKVITENGKLYFTIDGIKQKNSVCELDGEYYYAKADGSLTVNAVIWISANDYIAAGYYKFEEDGKLMKNGFITVPASGYTYYFIDGALAKGFTKIGEDYYMFNTQSGMMYKDANIWVGGTNPYGITAGTYYFQADGKMYIPDLINGERKVIEENGKLYFTIDGVKQKNSVCELDGEYYYAKSDGSLYVNAVVWVSANDYTAAGYYKFEEDGKLMKDGFMTVPATGTTYYFIDGALAKGFTKIGEDYYLFNTGSGMMYKDAKMWVGSNSYGIKAGMYSFGADGKMITE